MLHTLHTVRDYKDLLSTGAEEGAYDFDALFARLPHDGRSAGEERLETLRALDPYIRPMLVDGERVLFVTVGERTAPLESAMLGAVTCYVNRVALAVTDRRLLLIGVDEWSRPGPTRQQLRRAAVSSVTALPFGRLRVGLRSGGALWLTTIPKADREGLTQALSRFVPKRSGRSQDSPRLETMCGTCGRALGSREPACGSCRDAERRSGRTAWLALFIPGAGLLHLGRKLPALAQFLKALIILCALVIVIGNGGPWLAALVLAAWYATMSVGEWLLVRRHAAV